MKKCPLNNFADCIGQECQLWSEDRCRNQNTGASIDQIAENSEYLEHIHDTLFSINESLENMVSALVMISHKG